MLFGKFVSIFSRLRFLHICAYRLFLPADISAQYKYITSSFRVQILENGTLFIDNIDQSDAGLYLCHCSNGIGPDLSKIVRVSVHGKK